MLYIDSILYRATRPGMEDETTIRDRLKNARAAYRMNISLNELDAAMDLSINGAPTHSGVAVTGENAMNFSAVFCAVNIIAGSIASLPLQLYRRVGDGGKEPFRDHPLFDLLHNQPNPEMTSYVFREILQQHLLLTGNAYAEIIPDRVGRPAELWPTNPAVTKMQRDENNTIFYEVRETDGSARRIPVERMFHIPGLSFDGRTGYSVLAKARETFGLGLAMEEFQARFYGQGTNVGGVLMHPGKLSEEAHDRLATDLKDRRSGLSKSHTSMILEEGMKYEKLGMPLEDAQFLESRVFQVGEIARWFNLPPHKLKELSRATFSNIEAQQIEFVQDSIRPWAVRWEQHIAWKLLRPGERGTVFAEFNLDGLLRGDTKSRMEAHAALRNVGGINADEIRAKENMNPIGDLAGEMYWRPLNMGDASEAVAVPSAVTEEPEEEIEEPEEEDIDSMRVVK